MGPASITYLVYDNFAATPAAGSAYSNTATYTVTLTNTAPVAVNDSNGAIPNTALTFDITGNDTDANGNATINDASVVPRPLDPRP